MEQEAPAMPRATPGPKAYQLKVTLDGIEPPIWRRFVVPAEITLDILHDVLQDVMGWQQEHLYEFVIQKRHFTTSDVGDSWGFAGLNQPTAEDTSSTVLSA